jgi:S1-C subfamily serine protease
MRPPGHPSDSEPTQASPSFSHEEEDAAMNLLTQFSDALAGRVATAAPGVAALFTGGRRVQRSALLWQAGVLVTSEQGMPDGPAQAVLPGAVTVPATLAGRDPGTNIAVFRLDAPAPDRPEPAEAMVGALALLLGADEVGGVSARLGMVNVVGPAWTSMAGGRVDRLIRLDARLSPQEEGGPVLSASGQLLGMSTLGPRRRTLVIPTVTLERVVEALLTAGHVTRGWLGISLHPVAIPPAFQAEAAVAAGLMLMSLAPDGPAEAAGLLPGDILLAVDGVPAEDPRTVAKSLGLLPVGQTVMLRLLRGGIVQDLTAMIGARPAC